MADLMNFAANLARAQAGQPLKFPTYPITPVEDLTERTIQNVLGICDDFRAQRLEAMQWAIGPRLARLQQLRERVAACLVMLQDEGEQMTQALQPSQCVVSAADYAQHWKE